MPTLREARTRQRYSVTALAREAAVNRKTIWRCESGRNVPLPAIKRSIAAVLGLPVEAIRWRPERDV